MHFALVTRLRNRCSPVPCRTENQSAESVENKGSAAGLNFGLQAKGTNSTPLTVTLYNDPSDPNTETVDFAGKLVQGDYTESDTRPFSLTPGASCTLTIVFTPRVTGSDPGTITLSYNNGQVQTIYLRGSGE